MTCLTVSVNSSWEEAIQCWALMRRVREVQARLEGVAVARGSAATARDSTFNICEDWN